MDLERFVEKRLVPDLTDAEKPQILLLTCMDYRYAHRIVDVMDSRGLRRKYDMFALAGASLGANSNSRWRDALFTHIETAIAIKHPISKVFILEHRECGAYEHILGLKWCDVLPGREYAVHHEQVSKLMHSLKQKFPGLKVEAILLTRDEDDDLLAEKNPCELAEPDAAVDPPKAAGS